MGECDLMSKSFPTYNILFTRTFEKQLNKLRDKIRISRIKQKTQEIAQAPYRNIDFGAGRWRGKRKETVGDDRIFFTICEQCRKEEHKKFNLCSDCETTPDNTIKFVEIVESHKY